MILEDGPVDPRVSNVHHMDERGVWATRGRDILFRAPEDADWRRIGRFPLALPQDLASPSRHARRVLRLERSNVFPTRGGRVFGLRGGRAYRIEDGRAEPLFTIRGDCVMNRAIAESEDGDLYFGEYFMNPGRVPVRIWRVSADLERFEVAAELDSPRVRHVHAVHVDPFRPGRLWVTNGDFEGECHIAYSDDGFRTIEWLGDGTQTWRTVGLIFQEERICWMTDTHLEQNRVVTMDRESGALAFHGERDASTWYQAETTDGRYLATSCVEPGPGIQTRDCRLMVSENATDWTTVARYPKDALPFRFFGFGFLSLPSGRFSSEDFWLSGGGVVGLDDVARRCRVAAGTGAG